MLFVHVMHSVQNAASATIIRWYNQTWLKLKNRPTKIYFFPIFFAFHFLYSSFFPFHIFVSTFINIGNGGILNCYLFVIREIHECRSFSWKKKLQLKRVFFDFSWFLFICSINMFGIDHLFVGFFLDHTKWFQANGKLHPTNQAS